MATTIISTTLAPTATVDFVQSSPLAASEPPPIVHISKYLLKSTSTVLSYTFWFTCIIVSKLATPLSLFLRVFLYLFAPIYHFATTIFNVIILTPCNVLLHLAHDLYPFYVFITVACICSALIGLMARLAVSFIKDYFWPSPMRTPGTGIHPASQNGQPKARKRVSFKHDH